MGGRCAYFRCKSTNRKNSRHKVLFRFPIHDSNRLQMWLDNCGNSKITQLPRPQLYNKYLCADHFDKKHLLIEEGKKRRRLSYSAVPFHYEQDIIFSREGSPEEQNVLLPQRIDIRDPLGKEQTINSTVEEGREQTVNNTVKQEEEREQTVNNTVKQEEEREQTVNNTVEEEEGRNLYSPTPQEQRVNPQLTPECIKLKKALQISRKIIKRERNKYTKLINRTQGKNLINIDTFKFKSESSKIFTHMQFTRKRKAWSDEEKTFCSDLYCKSPATYKYLFNTGIVLAAPSTVQKWFQEINRSQPNQTQENNNNNL